MSELAVHYVKEVEVDMIGSEALKDIQVIFGGAEKHTDGLKLFQGIFELFNGSQLDSNALVFAMDELQDLGQEPVVAFRVLGSIDGQVVELFHDLHLVFDEVEEV